MRVRGCCRSPVGNCCCNHEFYCSGMDWLPGYLGTGLVDVTGTWNLKRSAGSMPTDLFNFFHFMSARPRSSNFHRAQFEKRSKKIQAGILSQKLQNFLTLSETRTHVSLENNHSRILHTYRCDMNLQMNGEKSTTMSPKTERSRVPGSKK